MLFEPAPFRRRRQPMPPGRSDAFLVAENLFSSLLVGPGIMASLSAAGFLQHFLPACWIGNFPLAGLIGLLCGWMLAFPVARWSARRLDPARLGHVVVVAVVSGLVWATPAACYGPSIGWMGGAPRMYLVAGLLSAGGLVWGGYLDCDRLIEE